MPKVEKHRKVSLLRLRIGIGMLILWWLPVYLTVPTLSELLGLKGNSHGKEMLFLSIIVVQTILGFAGLILTGKELALTLKDVKYKKLPITIWRLIWSGNTDIDKSYLKVKKPKKPAKIQIRNAVESISKPSLYSTLRSKEYIILLIIAAVLGVPISAFAYFFLYVINHLQTWAYNEVPNKIGLHGSHTWWVFVPLLIASFFVALTIKYFPGKGGHVPAEGFKIGGGPAMPKELPGIIVASIASIGLGVVIGPEAPLIALGGGLAYLSIKLLKRDVPAKTGAVVAATGSFAAISTLLGSPLLGAFLLMEASGLGGNMATVVLLPGLLGAGIGSLIFTGLNTLTGFGTFSLALPKLPYFARPDIKDFAWAIAIGLGAAVLGVILKKLGLYVNNLVTKKTILTVFAGGFVIALMAVTYARLSGHSPQDVLFSGQSAMPYFIVNAGKFSIGALLLLALTKGVAYGLSLGSFRGGPVFPSMFIGTVIGIALSHLPGLTLVPAVAIGIGSMSAAMLRLPLTSVLLATLLLESDGLAVMPLVIVSVVVSFLASTYLFPTELQTKELPAV